MRTASRVVATIATRCGVAASTSLLALTVALPALAAGDADGPDTKTLLFQGANLVLLLGVIVYVARKPLAGFFADRRSQIGSEIDDASAVLADAESRFAEWQRKLVALEEELESIRRTARERAQHERESILAEARDAAERIQRDASASLDQELRRAQSALRSEASDLAVEIAARILSEQIGEADRDRLLDEFISGIEADAAAAGRSV